MNINSTTTAMEEFDKRSGNRRCSNKACCWLSLSPSCFIIGCLSLGAALALYFLFPPFLSNFSSKQIEEKVLILPGHSSYDQLKDPDLPIYLDVYFFNITNPHNFSKGLEPPKIKEVGPYNFRENRVKYYNKSSYNEDKSELTYTQLKTFHFNPQRSANGASEDDTICTINLAMVGAIAQVLALDHVYIREPAILLLKAIFSDTNAQLHICQPASHLVFNYTDPLLHELHVNPALKLAKMNLPTEYVSIQVNASTDDAKPSIIETGVNNVTNIGLFLQWNGKTNLNIWFDDYANTIRGTEGLLFRPNLNEGEELTVFVDDTHRSFPVVYTGKKKIKGLETFRYELPWSVFQSAFSNPNNSRWGSWCPDGLFYIGVVQDPPVPVFASKPRFLDADPKDTTEKIPLLPPVRSLHDTFLYIHPLIGSTLQFTRSLQINLQVNYTTKFSQLEHINGTTYFPIFYITEHSELTDSFKSYLMKQGLEELAIAKYSSYSMIGLLGVVFVLGMFCFVCGAFKGIKHCRRKEYIALPSDDN